MNKQKTNFAYLLPYIIWIVLFVAAPVILVFYYSFFDIDQNFTFENYRRFFQPIYLKMALNSVLYAALITFFSLLVAFPLAIVLTKLKHKQLWLLLLILPTWINLLLKAYAFIGIFGTYGGANRLLEFIGIGTKQILFTDFSFLFVAVYIFIPFMLLPIFNSIEEISPFLLDAARDLGATRLTVLRRVIFPLAIDGVKSGVIAVFIPSLSLFMITRLITGNRVITLGTAIEQHFLVTQDWGMGATIAVFLIMTMVVMMVYLGNEKKIGGGRR